MFALLDDWIDREQLIETWHEITGDSYVVDVRKVKKDKDFSYSKAAAEVCKYALKFSELSVENTWEAFKVLKGKRLSGAFGSLYGVKIPENLADDMPDEKDLPYLEMLYRFVFGKKSYYDLEMTRHVEPQSKDKDERSGAERLRRGLASLDPHCTATRTQKATLASTTCNEGTSQKRIKRWDGFLCVMHM